MVEVDFLALFEGNFFHAAVVGIERNDGGPGQLPHKLFGQLGFPGAGRTGDADDVRSHSVVGGVIPVYNPRTASTRPSTVKTRASAATWMPSPRAVRVVTGPMETTGMSASVSAPAAATKFCTVEELVKVMQSGLGAAPNTSRACPAASSGTTVR